MPARSQPTAREAPTIDEVVIADDADRWEALGFTVRGGCCQLGSVRVRLAGGGAGRGIVGWSLRAVSSVELDGLPTTRSSSPVAVAAAVHPNGVAGIDHVVAVSPALERTVQALQGAGLDLRRVREQPTATGAARQAFFRLGAEILEVVQEPSERLADGAGERPARLWGLALLAADIDRTVRSLEPHAGPARDAVQPGRRITTVRRSAGLAVPVAVLSPAPGARGGR
jgi:hypothetical protein